MNNNLEMGDLYGIATITHKGAYSQLRTGESATFKPFAAFADMDLNTIKTAGFKNMKFHGILQRQKNKLYNNIVLQNTLLKRISEDMFFHQSNTNTITEVTGLKPIKWVKGKAIFKPLTAEQTLLCFLADFAYMQFGTLNNVSVQVGLNNGMVIDHKF